MSMHPNPVLPGFYPDPSVCRVGSDYFLVTSTFEYFPGVPIFHSTDLFTWRQIGHCLTRTSQLDLTGRRSSDGIYAPTLRYHDGVFYMITTDVGGAGHFFVTARDPAGPWSDPTYIAGPGFDPDLFFDDDGTVYFSREDITGHGIRQHVIDITTGDLLSEEKIIWEGLEDPLCEAPHIYRIGDWYYLLVAEGGTHRGHMVVIARGTHPTGPFESCPKNPILTHRHRVLSDVQAVGHGDLVQRADGSWWIFFLGIRPVGKWHHLGRETFIAPVDWEDGWPRINRGEAISISPNVSRRVVTPGFTQEGVLHQEWNTRGFLDSTFVQIDGAAQQIRLVPNGDGLAQTLGSAFLGHRQTSFRARISGVFDVSTLQNGEEAGVAAVMNEQHYYTIACQRRDDQWHVVVRKQIGATCIITSEASLPGQTLTPEESLYLEVSSDPRLFIFAYRYGGSARQTLDSGECRYLSTEVAGGFTGVYLGAYAGFYGESSTRSHEKGYALVTQLTYEDIAEI